MLDIVCFALGKWLFDRKSKESEMYDGHKYMKNSNKWKSFQPRTPFYGLEFQVNATFAEWEVTPSVAPFRVLGEKKTPTCIFLHIQENIRISDWVLYVSIFYNSELNLIPGRDILHWLSMNSLASFMWNEISHYEDNLPSGETQIDAEKKKKRKRKWPDVV